MEPAGPITQPDGAGPPGTGAAGATTGGSAGSGADPDPRCRGRLHRAPGGGRVARRQVVVVNRPAPDGAVLASMTIVGVGLLVFSWVCWSGRWTSWVKYPMAGNFPFTIAPWVGCFCLVGGLGWSLPKPLFIAVGSIVMPAFVAVLVLSIWQPRWFGPRWFRESLPGWDVSKRYDASVVRDNASLPAERNSELVARAARDDGELITSRWASLHEEGAGRPSGVHTEGVISGRLLLYRDELVFMANRGDDVLRGGPTIRTLNAADVTGARKVHVNPRATRDRPFRHPFVVIDTDRETWRLEVPSADRVLRFVREHYLGSEGGSSRV